MNFLIYALLPFDDIECWPLLVLAALFIMVMVIGSQLIFNPEARMRRKAEKAKRELDPNYWGSYEK